MGKAGWTTIAGAGSQVTVQVGRDPWVCDRVGMEVHVRNTGVNTLWISEDGGINWFDVASGTSWDCREELARLMLRTKVGTTSAVVMVTT